MAEWRNSMRANRPIIRTAIVGFTLIELLVVVAIIALLIAIVMPALNKARAAGRQTLCSSNLRQIAIGWHLYLIDYDGRYHQRGNAHFLYGGWKGKLEPQVPRVLNPYLALDLIIDAESGAPLFRCPEDKDVNGPMGERYNKAYGTSYFTNTLIVGNPHIQTLTTPELTAAINQRLPGIKEDQVHQPAQTILVGDAEWSIHWSPSLPAGKEWHKKDYYYNIAFCDGRVSLIKIKKGIHIDPEYRIIPFRELSEMAREVQQEIPVK